MIARSADTGALIDEALESCGALARHMQGQTGMTPILAAMLALSPPLKAADGASWVRSFPLDVHEFRVLGQDYDPENPGRQDKTYYRTIDDAGQSFIHGVYVPSTDSVTLFHEVPAQVRQGVRVMRWRWRALALPRNGNECVAGLGDSAAAVYVTWKRGLRWYSLKLAWSAEAPAGATCNVTRNPFVASDSMILRSGPPTGIWQEEEIEPDTLFRLHFEGGDPNAEVPELQGIGILTDGDQNHTVSAADYAGFVFYKQERTASR